MAWQFSYFLMLINLSFPKYLRSRIWQNFHLVIVTLCLGFLYFPVNSDINDLQSRGTLLSKSLRSTIFRDSVVLSIGVSSPILINSVLDCVQSEMSKFHIIARQLPVFSLFLTSLLMLCFVCNSGNSSLYYSIFYTEIIVLMSSWYCFLQEITSAIWSSRRICFCLGTFCAFLNLRSFEGHALYFGNILGIITFTCFVISFIAFAYVYILWYLKYVDSKAIYKESSDDLFLSWIYMNVLLVVYLIWIIWLWSYYGMSAQELGLAEITRQSYSVTAIILLFATLSSRRLRNDVFKAQVFNIFKNLFISWALKLQILKF